MMRGPLAISVIGSVVGGLIVYFFVVHVIDKRPDAGVRDAA